MESPQTWNRFSYVSNNPIRYNDPTGHMQANEDDGGVSGPTPPIPPRNDDTDTDDDGIPNIPDPDFPPIEPGRGQDPNCIPGNLVECFYSGGYMPAGNYDISWSEFWLLMKAIGYDLDQRALLADPEYRASLTDYRYRGWYDTPFYDGGKYATAEGALKSNLCVQMIGCFERHELNYIAQGQASAKAYEGRGLMVALITGWKIDQYEGSLPSYKTLRAASIGYSYYTWTHGSNMLTEILRLRNPVPFVNTVSAHCQSPVAQYC